MMRSSETLDLTFSDSGGELHGTALDAVGQNGCDKECR
jgi:hypothetical protein